MDRWKGKVVIVTGASSGVGLATAKELISSGLTVVGFARRKEKMEDLLGCSKESGKFYARQCDITQEESILENLNWVKETFGTINILINNAGTMYYKSLEEATMPEIDEVVDVNFVGLLHATKHAIPILKSNEQEAHIINVSCILANKIPSALASMNVYSATKSAVTTLSRTLSMELKDSKIRVSSITPDMIETELVDKIIFADTPSTLLNNAALDSEDVANAIIFALSAPTHVEISDIILQPKSS